MITCYIGLGSNMGDRLGHLRHAVFLLEATDGIELVTESSVYETEPVGPEQPDFLNAVIEVRTTLSARELLKRLKEIEAEIGRTPSERWGPREIDLDLLTYGRERIEDEDLTVPHPRMGERAFVLVPLAEIAPDVRLEAVETDGVRATGERLR